MGRNHPILSDEEGSSRMIYEGCPNQNPSLDDVTGYSFEEEEICLDGKGQFFKAVSLEKSA